MRRRQLLRLITVLGLLLIALWPLTRLGGPTLADYDLSESPFARIPLSAIRQSGTATVVFTVPQGPQWDRIRAEWHDPGIMVFAAPDARTVYEFPSLGLDVRVHNARAPIEATPVEYLPYLRSFAGNAAPPGRRITGVNFAGRPGDDLTLSVHAARPSALPDGELIVKYEWSGAQKDHIIAPGVEALGHRMLSVAVGLGVVLLGIVAVVSSLAGRR